MIDLPTTSPVQKQTKLLILISKNKTIKLSKSTLKYLKQFLTTCQKSQATENLRKQQKNENEIADNSFLKMLTL